MDLEHELRNALSHEKPSAGFASRVLQAVDTARDTGAATPARSHARVWRGLAAAAVLAAVIGGWGLRLIAERRAGERARDEVLLALRITSDKLQDARNHVNEIGSKD